MSVLSALKKPVPCISGAAGIPWGPASLTRSATASRSCSGGIRLLVVGVERAEHVVLAPHHALRHPGGAARVDQQQVVARTTPRAGGAAGSALRFGLVGHRPVGAGAAAVVDPEPQSDARHASADLLDRVGERAVEDDRHHVAVVPQVDELVGGVAVVRVDGAMPALQQANTLSRYSGQLWRYWATLSCSCSPAASSAAATPSARRSKSAQVWVRSPCCCASASGMRSAICSNTSAKFHPSRTAVPGTRRST
jgi:hypothetical protein